MKTDNQGVSPPHANKSISLKTRRSTKKRQEQVTPGTRNKLTKTNTWAFIYKEEQVNKGQVKSIRVGQTTRLGNKDKNCKVRQDRKEPQNK